MVTAITSLKDLGKVFGIKPKKREFSRHGKKCFHCGEDMVYIEGTNVWVCNGKREDGSPCGNRLILPPVA